MGSLPKIVCLLALLACAPLLHAQTAQPVYRCIGAHGEPVFSGQPCGTPAPTPATSTAPQGTSFSAVCAASPEALRQAITGAFATRDVNQLAGLILWRGMDQSSARATLRALAAWLKQPLTGVAFMHATGPPPLTDASVGPPPVASMAEPAGTSSAPAPPPTGFDVSTGGVDGTTRDFGLLESGGCWWLTF